MHSFWRVRSLSRNVYKMVRLRFSTPYWLLALWFCGVGVSECLFDKYTHTHIPQGHLKGFFRLCDLAYAKVEHPFHFNCSCSNMSCQCVGACRGSCDVCKQSRRSEPARFNLVKNPGCVFKTQYNTLEYQSFSSDQRDELTEKRENWQEGNWLTDWLTDWLRSDRQKRFSGCWWAVRSPSVCYTQGRLKPKLPISAPEILAGNYNWQLLHIGSLKMADTNVHVWQVVVSKVKGKWSLSYSLASEQKSPVFHKRVFTLRYVSTPHCRT